MSLPVILRPEADTDADTYFKELELIRVGLGLRFISCFRDVLARIESNPEMYGVVWEDIRAVRLRKFKYVVYHIVLADRVDALAVLQGARNESATKSRV